MAPSDPNRREPVICAECGAENRPSRFFCGSCGAYLRSDEDTWEGEGVTSTYRTDPPPPGTEETPAPPGPAPSPSGGPRERVGSGVSSSGPSEEDWLAWERTTTRRATRNSRPTRDAAPADSPPVSRRPSARSSNRWAGIVAAVFLIVAVAALLALVYSALTTEPSTETAGGGQTATTQEAAGGEQGGEGEQGGQAGEEGEGEPSTTTTTQIAEDPDPVTPGDVDASSELASQQGLSYGPENVLDDDLATSWQEGAEGSGESEWLLFTFDSPVTLVRMEVANGYQKDERRYLGNARPRQIRIEYSDGSSQMAQLEDEQGYQSVALAPKGTESLRIVVESVYRGNLWEDMAISEIRLFAAAEQ